MQPQFDMPTDCNPRPYIPLAVLMAQVIPAGHVEPEDRAPEAMPPPPPTALKIAPPDMAIRPRVRELLRKHGPLLARAIATLLDHDFDRTQSALQRMRRDGELIGEDLRGVPGRKHLWRLA